MLSPEYTDVGSFERLEVCCEDCRLDSGSETTLFPCDDSFLMFLVVHGSLTSRPASYGILNTFRCAELRCVTVFDGVDHVLLRMLRYFTIITARDV